MTGYLYDNEQAAAEAVAAINTRFGIPVSPNSVTRTYTDYMRWGDAWAIMADESLEAVLGEPIVLPVIEDDLSIGMFYRRSETLNEEGLYTVESSISPTLSDGTVLTESNKDTYDGAEGWHWYDSGQVVDLKVTSTR